MHNFAPLMKFLTGLEKILSECVFICDTLSAGTLGINPGFSGPINHVILLMHPGVRSLYYLSESKMLISPHETVKYTLFFSSRAKCEAI